MYGEVKVGGKVTKEVVRTEGKKRYREVRTKNSFFFFLREERDLYERVYVHETTERLTF